MTTFSQLKGHNGGLSFLLDMHAEHDLPILYNNFIDVGYQVDLSFGVPVAGKGSVVNRLIRFQNVVLTIELSTVIRSHVICYKTM